MANAYQRVRHCTLDPEIVITVTTCTEPLKVVHEGSDLEVTVSSDLKSTNHCRSACGNKPNAVLHHKEGECRAPGVITLLWGIT